MPDNSRSELDTNIDLILAKEYSYKPIVLPDPMLATIGKSNS